MSSTDLEQSWTGGSASPHGADSDVGFPEEVHESELSWGSQSTEVGTWRQRNSVRKQDVAEITSQLAIMTRSGVDVASALSSLANQCERPALAAVLADVHESVLAGNALSNALRMHDDVFDPTFVATVAAGEASGQMSEVLAQLASIQRSEMKLRRTIKAMLTYPVLLLVVSLAVVVALVLIVLPQFSQIFSDYDLVLPVITQVLLAVADEFHAHWWLWVPLGAALVVGGVAWRRSTSGRNQLDALWLQLPIVSTVYRSQLVGTMCRTFGLMLESGVPLLDVLRLTRDAIRNVHYQTLIEEMQDAVINGRSLASALEGAEIVPASAREMLITAESTGNLGEVTQLLGEYYAEDTESRMRQVVGLLEPLITIVMGLLVAIVVLAVMLPVFDLSSMSSR